MRPPAFHQTATILAILAWGGLTGMRLLQAWRTLQVIPALLAVQAGMVALQLMLRRPQTKPVPWSQMATAWVSACLPWVLEVAQDTLVGRVLGCAGIALALIAMGTLGRSFGIAPADRSLVQTGPYRWIRHPMYLGELSAVLGAIYGNLSPWNFLILSLLLLTILLRIHWEEAAIDGYPGYTGQVRWRLIPFIF